MSMTMDGTLMAASPFSVSPLDSVHSSPPQQDLVRYTNQAESRRSVGPFCGNMLAQVFLGGQSRSVQHPGATLVPVGD